MFKSSFIIINNLNYYKLNKFKLRFICSYIMCDNYNVVNKNSIKILNLNYNYLKRLKILIKNLYFSE